jgi:hypothetical protein
LGWSFFGLSSNYLTILMDDYYTMAHFLGTSYSDFMIIPTFQRKYLINKILEYNSPKT